MCVTSDSNMDKIDDVILLLDFQKEGMIEGEYSSSLFGESDSGIFCFPNPANDHIDLNLTSDVDGSGQVILRDMSGNILNSFMHSFVSGNNNITIDLTNFNTTGLIFISVITADGNVKTTSFIRE